MGTDIVRSHPDKSTNVRSQMIYPRPRRRREQPVGLRALRATLRALEAGSPSFAAALGEQLMFRTFRSPADPLGQSALDRGERLTIDGPSGPLAAWSWGTGPAVLLVHGWNGRASQMTPFVDRLVGLGLRAVAFDAPGHGESPGAQSSLFDFADAVDAAIDAVRTPFGPIQAVVAHSMGGAAVTYAMGRHRRAPITTVERALRGSGQLPVRRFALVAPPIDIGDFVRGFRARFGLGEETELALRSRIEARFGVPIADVYGPALAATLEAPVLVVHDESDREVPVDRGRTLAAAWPGAELEVTRGLGHMRILRDPGVLDRITHFVAHREEA